MSLRARHLWLLVLAGLALRGPWLLLSSGAPYDMESYLRAAEASAGGLYGAVETAGRYPYLPLWWLLLKPLRALQQWLGGDFALWARLPGVAGDLGVSALLYLIVERRSRSIAAMAAGPEALLSTRAGLIAGLGWALNPLAALISVGHGQFDSLALALLLAGAWWLEYSSSTRSEIFAALSLAAAIALKTWPLAFLPLYLGVFASRREAARFAFWALLPPLLLLLPFGLLSGSDAVFARLGYSGATALGLSGALRASFFAADAPVQFYTQVDGLWRIVSMSTLILGWLWALWQRRRLRLLESLPWAALSLVLLAPGLSPQYLLWPAALGLLLGTPFALRYHLWTLPLLVTFYALFMPSVLAGQAAWTAPTLPPWAVLLWAAFNLAWWAWALGTWLQLSRMNLTPRRGTIFR